MNCQEVMDDMQRQLDGDLDDLESEALMTHLRHCPDCAAMFERLQLLSSGLENLPKVTPPYSLVDAILPRLPQIAAVTDEMPAASAVEEAPAIPDELTERRAKRTRSWTDSYAVRALGGVVAAAVVAGLFMVTYSPSGSGSMDDSANTAQYAADAADAGESAAAEKSTVAPSMLKADEAPQEKAIASSANEDATGSAQPQADPPEELSRSIDAGDDAAPAQGDGGGTAQGLAEGGSEPVVRSQTPNQVIEVPSDAAAGSNSSEGADLDTKDTGKQQDAADAGVQALEEEGTDPNKKMGITSMSEAALLQSPDGVYSASIEQNVLTIFLSADDRFVLSTDAAPGGIRIVEWASDSESLTYEATAKDGTKKTYRIDLVKETITPLQNTP
ncbi:anti-sigma factor family protein [Paenibacillus aurantiacus]|uniref:Anti-sigma-W factor RsiW n=1 Tax=Paenibacillus aurantiacus TaxID=1936118 RepID=A0ABV5KK27_9BACL